MQIPKTISAVADPGEPSLLTSIPPEIRNAIYEVLFKREGPVLLHNAEAYHSVRPERKNYDADSEYKEELGLFLDRYEREIGAGDDFHHEFHEGISLLLSCRQIYHEAVGVLYSSNSFMVSRVLYRHDNDDDSMFYPQSEDYLQSQYAPRWLSALGSQLNFLRRFTIDVDAMCPDDCDYQIGGIDLLPLIQLLWSCPELSKVVTFGHSGRALTVHSNSHAGNLRLEGKEDKIDADIAIMLNNILSAIAIEDMLNIKRYGYSSHLLESVVIYTGYEGHEDGHVVFRTKDETSQMNIYFRTFDNGRVVKPKMERQQPQLLSNLPTNILKRIYNLVCMNYRKIVFDLDTSTLRGLDTSPYHLDSSLRSYWRLINLVPRANDTIIKMTSTEPSTDFNQFHSWQNFLRQCDSSSRTNLFRCVIYASNRQFPLIVSMEFMLAMPMTLLDIRIDILGLMSSFETFLHLDVALHFMVSSPRSSGRLTEETRVALAKLQKNLFLLLSDIMKIYGDMALPNVWIDGRGNILYATIHTVSKRLTQKYTFRHSKLTRAEISERGYYMATTLNRKYKEYLAVPVPGSTRRQSLIYVWNSLRSTHWRDWSAYGMSHS